MIGRGLTVLLCCAVLCWTQDIEWNWTCDNVTEQAGVNMSQVLGRWYMASANIPGMETVDYCTFAEFLNLNQDASILDMYLRMNVSEKCVYQSNSTINVISPSKWHNGANPIAVVDLPPQGDTLAVVGCKEKSNSTSQTVVLIIFSKSKSPDLQPALSRMLAAGIPEWNNLTMFNLSSCQTDFV